jgi:two-component system chemotaxis response regulator CheB
VLSEVSAQGRCATIARSPCRDCGHLYEEQEPGIEEALRLAMRLMEERLELVKRMRADAMRSGRNAVADLYGDRIAGYKGYAETLRRAVRAWMEPVADKGSDAN